MPTTRGGLVPARISKDGGAPFVACMFNPAEYTIAKTNSYSPGTDVGKSTSNKKFKNGQPRTLNLKLYFDTYQDGPQAEPVTKYTSTLFRLMMVEEGTNGNDPPDVEFSWGSFSFKGRITSLSVNFTLFDKDGKPLRAIATVTLTEKPDVIITAETATRSWEGQTVRKTADSSITAIAAKFTDDPASYRTIAAANNLDNPNKMKNGATVIVPDKNSMSLGASLSVSVAVAVEPPKPPTPPRPPRRP